MSKPYKTETYDEEEDIKEYINLENTSIKLSKLIMIFVNFELLSKSKKNFVHA